MRKLVEAAREAGWGINVAAGLLAEASRFGQAAWASPADPSALENVRMLKSLRGDLLEMAQSEEAARALRSKGIFSILTYREGWIAKEMGIKAGEISTEQKMLFAKTRLISQDGIQSIATDPEAEDIATFLSGAGLPLTEKASAGKSWEDLEASAGRVAPGEGFLDPEGVEAALEEKALGILARFGLSQIRIGGLPSEREARDRMDRLEMALGDLAERLGIPEREIGLSGRNSKGLTIHMETPMAWGGCFSTYPGDRSALSLRVNDGFSALAHEWFHAFDSALGAAVSNQGVYGSPLLSEMAEKNPKLGSAMTAAEGSEAIAATREALEAIRSGDGEAALEALRAESKERAIQRCLEGLYDKHMISKVSPEKDPGAARKEFGELYSEMLEGRQGKEELADWRRRWLADKHQGGTAGTIVLAEARVRRESLRFPKKSLMQAFAEESERDLAEAGSATGYSTSPEEMLARGFEGNMFIDLPKERRAALTDCEDDILYWPAGPERGKAIPAYRRLIQAGMGFLREREFPSPDPEMAHLCDDREAFATERPLAGADTETSTAGELGRKIAEFRKNKSKPEKSLGKKGPKSGAGGRQG